MYIKEEAKRLFVDYSVLLFEVKENEKCKQCEYQKAETEWFGFSFEVSFHVCLKLEPVIYLILHNCFFLETK